MYTEAERVKIRMYLGVTVDYADLDRPVENAITWSQALAEGGMRATNDAELQVRATIADLDEVEGKLKKLVSAGIALGAGDVKLDAARGYVLACRHGRHLVHRLELLLNVRKRGDVFSPAGMAGPRYDLSRFTPGE